MSEAAPVDSAADKAAKEAAKAAKKLAEARQTASILGGQIAFDRLTAARFLSAEIEGMKKDVDNPSIKRAPRPQDDGKIDVSGVKRVLRGHRGELQSCYERALKRDPALRGTVTLTIRIGEGGAPILTRARSHELKSSSTLECMERASRQWLFPVPTGGTVLVNKPFTFQPKI